MKRGTYEYVLGSMSRTYNLIKDYRLGRKKKEQKDGCSKKKRKNGMVEGEVGKRDGVNATC